MSRPASDNETIVQRLESNLAHHGDQTALVFWREAATRQRYSLCELVKRARQWARRFELDGLVPADRVVVALDHGFDLYASYLGAVLGGFVPAMIALPSAKQHQAVTKRTAALIDRVGARVLVAEADFARHIGRCVNEVDPAIRVVGPVDAASGNEEAGPNQLSTGAIDAASPAFIQFSSGTTGRKKAVAITHQMLLGQIDTYARHIELSRDDVIVSWLPLYHDMGLIACYWLPLLAGPEVVAMSPFEWVRRPAMLFEAITAHRATLCWQPNFAYNHLVRSVPREAHAAFDLSTMRGFVNCSEPVLAASHARFASHFEAAGLRADALWSCYAMAENTFAVTASGQGDGCVVDQVDPRALERGRADPSHAAGEQAKRLVSSGGVLGGTQVRIVDDEGHALGDRAVGQIAVRSPSMLCEYLGDAAATRMALRDGWYMTGDYGYLALAAC